MKSVRRGNALHASAFSQGSCTPGDLYRTRTRTPALFKLIFQWILPPFHTACHANLSPKHKISAARHNLDWSAMLARLLFEGDDAVLHNTVQTPSHRGHRSLPAAAARFLCGRSLTPARITDITLSWMTLGKCHLLVCDVTLTPTRIADITPWRKRLVPAVMLCPGFCIRSLRRRSER